MPSRSPEERSIAEAAAQLLAVAQTLDVLALTPDENLLATLREALGTGHRISHANTRDDAVALLMGGRVGVIVLDTVATPDDAAEFCERLRTQFPDLVLIVAGGAQEQAHLVKQITAGDIYRFLHKPVSPARARQFVEAAMRRHLAGRTFTPAETASAAQPTTTKRIYIAAALGVLIVMAIAGAVTLLVRGSGPSAPAPAHVVASAQSKAETSTPLPVSAPESSAPLQSGVAEPAAALSEPVAYKPAASVPDERTALLARATELVAAGQLVAPARPSAAELYADVLALDPANPEALAGLDDIADRLLSNAEAALLEDRVDDAARDIESARQVRPNNVRLAFLGSQLVKERERRYIALARQASEAGDYQRAQILLDKAAEGQRTPSAVLTEVRKELNRRRLGDNVDGLLKLANERMKQGKLLDPADDSAYGYIQAALAADSTSSDARQARLALADRLVVSAREAMTRRELGTADRLLSQAESMGAQRTPLRAAQRELQSVRQTVQRGNEAERLATLLQQSLDAGRFVDPERDSARFYWTELRALDSRHAGLAPALQVLGAQMVQLGRVSFGRGDIDATQRMVDGVREMGYRGDDLAVLERDLVASRDRAAFLLDVVPAHKLERVRQPSPRYPVSAERQRLEGSVEIEFTVTVDGSVKDIVVTAATPPNVFEDAATRALSQWKFRPVIKNGQVAEQRARVLVKFDLPD